MKRFLFPESVAELTHLLNTQSKHFKILSSLYNLNQTQTCHISFSILHQMIELIVHIQTKTHQVNIYKFKIPSLFMSLCNVRDTSSFCTISFLATCLQLIRVKAIHNIKFVTLYMFFFMEIFTPHAKFKFASFQL